MHPIESNDVDASVLKVQDIECELLDELTMTINQRRAYIDTLNWKRQNKLKNGVHAQQRTFT
jgi:hypothetical protein